MRQHIVSEYISGWHGWENDGLQEFQWSGSIAVITIAKSENIDEPDNRIVTVSVSIGTPIENHICIFSHSKTIIDARLMPGWRTFRFKLDLAKKQVLRFKVKNTIKDGLRKLGVMIGRLNYSTAYNICFYRSLHKPSTNTMATTLKKPFISTYYYLWYFTPEGIRSKKKFTGKWSEGYARALLAPPQYPTLGEYVMNDPAVIEAHIDWAADHGIDCFICNWEGMKGHRKFLSENLVHILQGSRSDGSWSDGKINYSRKDATGNGWDSVSNGWHCNGYPIRNLERMKFSALIESRLIVETWPPTTNSKECLKAFSDAIIYMADNFFCSPQWQRINNKPVVYLYEVYSWKGNKSAFSEFRERIDNAVQQVKDPFTNQPFEGVYLIADVVYPYQQDIDRLEVFDAVTGYQPYPPVTTGEANRGRDGWIFRGEGLFRCPAFEAYHRSFSEWCKKTGIALIPTVIPKYNDRGVRGAVDHYAYPPVSTKPYHDVQDARIGLLFKKNIEAQLRWVSAEINMLNINSWNEWFEDTSIEPVGFFPESKLPDYCNQGSNVGKSTNCGHDMRVPEKIVIYDKNGHSWVDTPEEIMRNGIDITQGYEWPCYGFDYLFALRDFFGISYPEKAPIDSEKMDC